MPVETPDIKVTKISEEPGAANLKVEVPAERVDAATHAAAKSYQRRAKLRGFRKGKAPLGIVRKHYHDAIREDVLRTLVSESWRTAVEQETLKPIADPRVRDLKMNEGQPWTFELVVEVKPEITLDRLGGFTIERTEKPVTDAMVREQIDELRKQKAPWVPLEGRQPALGDLASLSVATVTDGDAGESGQYQIVLGDGQAIPELEELVLTLTPGETKRGTVRYPDDFPDESKRGQSRVVEVTLHEVKRQQLPELDDAFARELGDFDTVADLERAVREDLETSARREADADMRRQLIEQIVQANGLEAPRPLVQRVMSAYAQGYGVPDDQLERFAQEFRPVAERQVLRDLVIDKVAEQESLWADEDAVDARVAELAERRGTSPTELRAS
ncbi:MAG: trigger factor, partial [Gemmatimonadales bacterium]